MSVQFEFLPQTGEFNITEAEAVLGALPFTFRDPTTPGGPFLLCGDGAKTQYARQSCFTGGDYPRTVCLVILSPQRIVVAAPANSAQAQDFVHWIVDHYACDIHDDYGGDHTGKNWEELKSLVA